MVDLQEDFKETEEVMGSLVQFSTSGEVAALIQSFLESLKSVLHKGEYGSAKN